MKTGPAKVDQWTPEQLAWRGWQVHAVGCKACREGCCPSGRTLGNRWKRIRRANRAASREGKH
ncbi:hypothetical protein ACH4GE_18740 [Streptomyces tendae]|uniref:hypothetical protein n=1 Tax=Streptomyces TaxID=1883 RepID=UPI0037A4451D